MCSGNLVGCLTSLPVVAHNALLDTLLSPGVLCKLLSMELHALFGVSFCRITSLHLAAMFGCSFLILATLAAIAAIQALVVWSKGTSKFLNK